jgi:hypothetical protein
LAKITEAMTGRSPLVFSTLMFYHTSNQSDKEKGCNNQKDLDVRVFGFVHKVVEQSNTDQENLFHRLRPPGAK